MEADLIDLNQVDSQQAAHNISQIYYEGMFDDTVFRKEYCKSILSQIYKHLAQKNTGPPETKFYIMIILKDLISKKNKNIIGLLNSSTLIDLFEKYALQTDPKKRMAEKGLNFFRDKKGTEGNKFMRILLEMLVFLGKTYVNSSSSQPTKFRKCLSRLQQQNVVLPTEFQYFQLKQKKTSVNEKSSSQPAPKVQQKKQEKKKLNLQSMIRFMDFKIEEYIQNLDNAAEEEEVEEMQKIMREKHEMFQVETKNFQQFGEQIYQFPQNVVTKYLQILGFLQTQNVIYNQEMPKNQLKMYYDRIKITYEDIFNKNQDQTPKQFLIYIDQKEKMKEIKPVEQKRSKKNELSNKDIKSSIEPRIPSTLEKIKKDPGENKINNAGAQSIIGIFERLQSRSKSPHNGFRLVKQSLQKQKSRIHAHPPRVRNDALRTVASTLTKTGMKAHSIFKNPPNLAPSYKNFEGQMILPCKQIQNVLFDIKKEQSHRRFKIANFRNRYPLFQNQSIQIGFKSEAIFQANEDGFNQILSIELYFGNKTARQLRNCEVIFEGDQNSLIYTNPRDFPSYIQAQQQVKYQLMIVPLKVPHCFLTMKVMYQNISETIHTTVALPNSILKMTTYVEVDRVENEQYWYHSTMKFKTDYFKLSHHTPPNSLRKYIPQLNQMTNYSQFSLPGSNIDYQLFCLVEIMKDYQCSLKINIRPDLNVVVQIGMIDPSEDAQKYAKFFMQTLQMILQDNGN